MADTSLSDQIEATESEVLAYLHELVPSVVELCGRECQMTARHTSKKTSRIVNAVDRLVGHNIKTRRERMGLGVNDLARGAELSLHCFVACERGHTRLLAPPLSSIGQMLGVRPEFFLIGVVPDNPFLHINGPDPGIGNVDDATRLHFTCLVMRSPVRQVLNAQAAEMVREWQPNNHTPTIF